MTCNQFKKAIESAFGPCEYKAISAEGKIYKSAGWVDTPESEWKQVTPSETHKSILRGGEK